MLLICWSALLSGCGPARGPVVEVCPDDETRPAAADLLRVTTAAPFPRGLALVDGTLYVLCRGRVRGAGGVSSEVEDQAGTLYAADPDIAEPALQHEVGAAVRSNGRVVARPTEPPFRLWDRTAQPPHADRRTDRPYCVLRYHRATDSFYVCAFSGIDQPQQVGQASFSKNHSDAILRFDRRTRRWSDIERHDGAAGDRYPHHDVDMHAPPHGWLKGPDNCLPVGDGLYAVAKDNSCLVRYELSSTAHPPRSTRVLGPDVRIRHRGVQSYYGHSALAARDGWLYVACRTSSVIFRIALDPAGRVVQPIVGELVAEFEPYDPVTLRSANLTDMDFDAGGRLYVVSAQPARIHRFRPDPSQPYDGRRVAPWVDLAALTANPAMKSENLLIDGNRLYVTSGDGYAYQHGAHGTVYRLPIRD